LLVRLTVTNSPFTSTLSLAIICWAIDANSAVSSMLNHLQQKSENEAD
jgi:hypothetical protein